MSNRGWVPPCDTFIHDEDDFWGMVDEADAARRDAETYKQAMNDTIAARGLVLAKQNTWHGIRKGA